LLSLSCGPNVSILRETGVKSCSCSFNDHIGLDWTVRVLSKLLKVPPVRRSNLLHLDHNVCCFCNVTRQVVACHIEGLDLSVDEGSTPRLSFQVEFIVSSQVPIGVCNLCSPPCTIEDYRVAFKSVDDWVSLCVSSDGWNGWLKVTNYLT
jgi:hypothetical protein